MSQLRDRSEHEYSSQVEEDADMSEYQELEYMPEGSAGKDMDPHREIKHQLNKGLTDIKKHLKERKRRYKKELSDRIKVIEKNEQKLSNISEKFKDRWKKIQKKTLFLSLLRRILRNARNFGIDPNKLPEVAVNEDEVAKKCTVIYPDSLFYKFHITILLFIFFYLIIVFPLDLAFNINEQSNVWLVADYFITAYFGIDILISFFTAYNKEGVIVDSNRTIALNYLLKWFILDLITVVPFDIIFELENFKYKRLFKLPRMMRLFNSLFQNTESKKKTRGFVQEKLKKIFSSSRMYYITVSMMVTIVFVHISACLWCLMLSFNDENWLAA
jgi:Ion transport protein